MTTFKELCEKRFSTTRFQEGQYPSDIYQYFRTHNVHQIKDRVGLFKQWFLAGRTLNVNAPARGRVVLKYEPALVKLLKSGFIVKTREHRGWISGTRGKQLYGHNVLRLSK